MEITLDALSFGLLGLIVLLSLVHILLLRTPEPLTHPLLLGRQSELARVRKPSESPVFLSASTGHGGLAKNQLRNCRTLARVWHGQGAKILLGLNGPAALLDEKVHGVHDAIKAGLDGDEQFKIRLEDSADAFITILATGLSKAIPNKLPLVVGTSQAVLSDLSPPLATSPAELASIRAIVKPSPSSSNSLYLISPAQPSPVAPQVKSLEGFQCHNVSIESVRGESPQAAPEETKDSSAIEILRMTVSSTLAEGIVEIANKNLMQGGIVSILSMFPPSEKISASDRILSFENVSTPYGLSVASTAAAVGATMRLCSAAKGITSKCRTFSPSIIFCTPNELNAFQASMKATLWKGGPLAPLAVSRKRSLLAAGTVSKTTVWDRFLADVRKPIVGDKLRCIVVSAEEGSGPASECVQFLRAVLGVPVIVTLTHPLIAGPISNTLFHDFQAFPADALSYHVGSPSATVECKLVGLSDDEVPAEPSTYRGELAVRGPSVVRSYIRSKTLEDPTLADGFTKTGMWAELRSNGTLKIIDRL